MKIINSEGGYIKSRMSHLKQTNQANGIEAISSLNDILYKSNAAGSAPSTVGDFNHARTYRQAPGHRECPGHHIGIQRQDL
jgi:hypothetical protein